MNIEGIGSKMTEAGFEAGKSEAASVQRQIRMIQKELNQLGQKKELTREEAEKEGAGETDCGAETAVTENKGQRSKRKTGKARDGGKSFTERGG